MRLANFEKDQEKDKIDKMSANLIVNFGIKLCEKQKGKKDNICESILKTI